MVIVILKVHPVVTLKVPQELIDWLKNGNAILFGIAQVGGQVWDPWRFLVVLTVCVEVFVGICEGDDILRDHDLGVS